ncbi:MAG: hypothetical protein ACYC6L_12790, partial [Anaerolineae bacterium]
MILDLNAPDPLTPAERQAHAGQVSALWRDYANHRNQRVPISFACDEQLWMKAEGCTFGEFYRDPQRHLWAQLKGRKWFTRHVIADMPPYPPEQWPVACQLWMEENEYYGCDVIYQEDNYAWGQPLRLDKPSLLAHLRDLDPQDRVQRSRAYRLFQELKALSADLQYEDHPVQIVAPGQGTHGIFTKAAEVRGLEQLCLDLIEDPGF